MKRLVTTVGEFATEIRRRKVDLAAVAYVLPTGSIWAITDRVLDTVPDTWNDTITWLWCTGLVLWLWFTWLFRWDGRRFVAYQPLRAEQIFWRWTGRLAIPVVFAASLGAWLFWPSPTLAVALEASNPAAELYRYKATERIQRALEHERHLEVVVLPAQKQATTFSANAELTGKVLEESGKLIISVQLVKVKKSHRYVAWTSGSYVLPADSVIKFEQRFDSIATLVADSIRPRFLPRLQSLRLPGLLTKHARASAEYGKGRLLLERESPEYLDSARVHFQRAISADPEMGAAYAGMADIYLVLRERGIFTSAESCDTASRFIEQAKRRDPNAAEVLTSHGVYHLRCTWQLDRAKRSLHGAVRASPDYQRAHRWYGIVLAYDGDFRNARSELAQAKRIEPLSYGVRLSFARALILEGEYELAASELQELLNLELQPGNDSEHVRIEATRALALAYARLGHSDKAQELLNALLNDVARNSPATLSAIGQVYAVLGNNDELRRVQAKLAECFSPANFPPYATAYQHVLANQDSIAFLWLLRGAKARDPAVLNALQDPVFASMRRERIYRPHLRSAPALHAAANQRLEADTLWYRQAPIGPCHIPRRTR